MIPHAFFWGGEIMRRDPPCCFFFFFLSRWRCRKKVPSVPGRWAGDTSKPSLHVGCHHQVCGWMLNKLLQDFDQSDSELQDMIEQKVRVVQNPDSKWLVCLATIALTLTCNLDLENHIKLINKRWSRWAHQKDSHSFPDHSIKNTIV